MSQHIICCHACDEICHVERPHKEGRFHCPNCGTLLFRHRHGMIERMYALSLAATLLFALVNAFPFLTFSVMGNSSEAYFYTSIQYLFDEGEFLMGVAILMTTVVIPLMHILLNLILFGSLYHQVMPYMTPFYLKVLHYSKSWMMLDVYLIGALVSIVKLVKMGTVVPGTGMWAFAALIIVIAAMLVTANAHMVWEIVDEQRGKTLPKEAV